MQHLPTALTDAIIQQTVKLSPDRGETLDFSHRNLSGVDDAAARHLAFPNGEHGQDESLVTRRVLVHFLATTRRSELTCIGLP
jgi:hypothetical protein